MAAAAIIVTALIAVGGWLVSQAQARRATRRNMRIDYLLQAYRRLDRASNRSLVPEVAAELEAAIGDVMLLGSPEQAGLAETFVKKIAAEHQADSQPLLLDLRASLRQELLLGELPQSAYVSLRVSTDGDMASETARVWREALESAQRALRPELESIEMSENEISSMSPALMGELVRHVAPSAGIDMAAGYIGQLLRDLFSVPNNVDTRRLSIQELADRARFEGLIDNNMGFALHGLGGMSDIARNDPERVTEWQAAEFVGTAVSLAYLLQVAIKKRESVEASDRHAVAGE